MRRIGLAVVLTLSFSLALLVAGAQQAEKVHRIGYLGNASALAEAKRVESLRKAMESAADSLKVELKRFEARGPSEFESALSSIAKSRVDAVVVSSDVVFNHHLAALADLAAKKRLPSAGIKAFAEAGGLIGYGLNFPEMSRRAAYFVDRTLKGVKPADLPIQQPTKFEPIINMKTAKALGLTIPQSLLVRADEIIQ